MMNYTAHVILTAKMITSMMQNHNESAKGLEYVLKNINYNNLRRGLARSEQHPEQRVTIVLMEYLHAGSHEEIMEYQRIPGTTLSVHDFLTKEETRGLLKNLFVYDSGMTLYTRRKINSNDTTIYGLTKYRQLVLSIEPTDLSGITYVSEVDQEAYMS